MSEALMKLRMLDGQLREGLEYFPQYLDIRSKYYQIHALELEYDYAVLVEEKNEFHRRVKENDRPGRRHMLPFTWRKEIGYASVPSMHQVPIRFESVAYQSKMAEYAKKIDAARTAWRRAKAIVG